MFCGLEDGAYRLSFEHFADRIELPRATRAGALAAYAARYAARLDAYCRRWPLQWYNFYPFWAAPVTGPATSSWPGLARPSTTLLRSQEDMDARAKPGHDG